MPLVEQKIPLVFRGLDTKTDPRHQVVGDLVTLQNVRLDAYPKLLKRYGYGPLVAADSGSLLAAYKNQLLIGTGSEAESYTSRGTLVDKGVLESLSLSVQPAVRNAYTQQTCDMAVHSAGITVYTSESIEAGSTVSRYSVFDSATQQPIVSNALVAANALRPKPFALGNYVVIIYFDSVSTDLRQIAIPVVSPSSPLAASDLANDPQTAPVVYDATLIAGTLYLAYVTTTGKIAVTTLSPALVAGSEAQLITVTDPTTATLGIFGDTSDNVWIGFGRFTSHGPPTTIVSVAAFTSALAPLLVSTPIETFIGTVHNITGIASVTTTATLFYEVTGAVTYNTLVRTSTVTVGGSISGTGVFLRSVGLASKPFYYLGRTHLLLAYQSTLQSTYFLASGTTVVGKAAPGVGGGLTANASMLPEACTVDTGVFSMAYLQADQLSSSGGDVFTQAGVQGATWDFSAAPVALELSDDLHITGGILSMYDGAQVCEHGFNLFPEAIVFQATGSGAFTGSYQTFAIYEWMDNYGQIHQSSPSPVATVVATSKAGFSYTVPTLRLTSKVTPIGIAIYRTVANGTAFFRVTSISSPLLNSTAVDTVSTTDAVADATLTGNAQPYTNPDNVAAEVPNLPVPAPVHIGRYRNRAIVIPAESPFQWLFSKALVPGNPVEFNPQQLFQAVEQDGGALTCSMEMDDKLVLFSADRLRYAVGDGPAANGANSDYTNAYHIPSDVGCANPRSLVLIPQGIMFQSAKGIYLLDRGLGVHYIGAGVEAFNSATVTSAKLLPNTRCVLFTLDTGVALPYDYTGLVIMDGIMQRPGMWGVWTGHDAADAAIFGGLITYLQPGGTVLQQTPGAWSDNGQPILQALTTSWLSFAGISGYQRVWRFNVRGDYRSPHILNVSVAVDDNPGTVQTERVILPGDILGEQPVFDTTVFDTDSPGGGAYPPYEFTVKLRRQKCASVQITIQEQQTGPDFGEGFALSAITFLVGGIKGLHKVPANRSI